MPELNANACGQDDLNDMLRDSELETPMGKSTLTPKPMARKCAYKSNKLQRNKALNHGGVKKKVNSNSKKGPAHWRKEALRQILAGLS